MQDLCQRAQMPDMLEDYAESHERFSVSVGKKEENNKLIKLILPPGRPSAEIWYMVCRKAMSLKFNNMYAMHQA